MTHDQLNAALADLDLSQARLAKIVGAEKGTVNRWTKGHQRIPHAVAIIVSMLTARIVRPEFLEGLSVG